MEVTGDITEPKTRKILENRNTHWFSTVCGKKQVWEDISLRNVSLADVGTGMDWCQLRSMVTEVKCIVTWLTHKVVLDWLASKIHLLKQIIVWLKASSGDSGYQGSEAVTLFLRVWRLLILNLLIKMKCQGGKTLLGRNRLHSSPPIISMTKLLFSKEMK